MSALELRTAQACVDAITASLEESLKLLNERSKRIPKSPQGGPSAAADLSQSLQVGKKNVRAQYDRSCQRFGSAFAHGDRESLFVSSPYVVPILTILPGPETAIDALTQILLHLQQSVIANLEELDESFSLAALQDVVDSAENRSILAILQLQQRLITAGSTENAKPLPLLNALKSLPPPPDEEEVATPTATSPPGLPEDGFRPDHETPSLIPTKAITPPRSPRPLPHPSRRAASSTSIQRSLNESDFLADLPRSQTQYRPMATTVTKAGFFGFGKRTKVEAVVEPPDNPLVDEYLATAILDEYRNLGRAERAGSVSTIASSSTTEAEAPNIAAFLEGGSPTPHASPNRSESRLRGSLESWHRSSVVRHPDQEVLTSNRSLSSIKPNDLLPSEMNGYKGFCKGAWRQQIGDQKRAMDDRIRPAGIHNAARYWQCKECRFEGRLVAIDKKKGVHDPRVFRLADGVFFRWMWLFKSHISQKNSLPDPSRAIFGCLFCCAEIGSTQQFEGAQAFCLHLRDNHRDPLPTGEVLYRANCLVGRQAQIHESFDLNLVSRDGGLF